MTDKKHSINTPLPFREIKTLVDDFIKTVNNNGNIQIISEMIIKEFRNYYTPNIPYTMYQSGEDENIFIKNRVFELEYPDTSHHYILVHVKDSNSQDVKEVISFREFVHTYCNPEGIYILEKLGFIIENTDFEQEEQTRREILGVPDIMDYDDDIPF
jgi:hypothetical protein